MRIKATTTVTEDGSLHHSVKLIHADIVWLETHGVQSTSTGCPNVASLTTILLDELYHEAERTYKNAVSAGIVKSYCPPVARDDLSP